MSFASLLDAHLEQISLCASSLASLPFPPPNIFTNALLHPHDITTLIRDTEAHERALFTVPPPSAPKAADLSGSVGANRRNTTFNPNGGNNLIGGGGANAMRAPRRNTAVAAVLGGDLVERIRRGGGGGAGSGLGYRTTEGRERGEVDVEVLLEGAEKLCGVYPIPGAAEKIMRMRQRHQRLISSIENYELRVSDQATQLNRMNRRDFGSDDDEDVDAGHQIIVEETPMTEEDLIQEEKEIKELEKKKRELEDRVTAMEKDISGVLR